MVKILLLIKTVNVAQLWIKQDRNQSEKKYK